MKRKHIQTTKRRMFTFLLGGLLIFGEPLAALCPSFIQQETKIQAASLTSNSKQASLSATKTFVCV